MIDAWSAETTRPPMGDILKELASLRDQVHSRSMPVSPVRFGTTSEAAFSPQNSQISSMSMMGYSSATPIYLEKFTSADLREFRQAMMMHPWPNPYYKYVHHTIMDYVKGQWNVFSENSMRKIPRFEDSSNMVADQWLTFGSTLWRWRRSYPK